MPAAAPQRVEVRRLASWFNDKFHSEVSGPLVTERVFKRHMTREQGGGPPDTDALRAARTNIRYHLAYIGWLVRTRDWLAGDAAELCRSRRGRRICRRPITWAKCHGTKTKPAKNWYARVKSRPSFRPILADTLAGVPAAKTLRQSRLLTDPARSRRR